MAPPAMLRSFSRLLAPARLPNRSSARSKFYVREPLHDKPDWLKVGLTLGTSVFLWAYVSLYSLTSWDPSTVGRRNFSVRLNVVSKSPMR
ncbi:PREDICTED: NADH dehydrogenase [ubiquinone] 1 subunit C1, mitochondrial isoform X1 [Miniopterus natalensis]|uniref:NADH dehydrogenase [ubiquinone] 1 subunit C1, mitochondrial isoform X1 n=1 Tax=Miniopterus natalensis TaxID=291302 RepID=UPI0007A6A613|nr:PREDICTED: NADH dehydrogenase [ubiquinone] 1 subunit C1, mitochondrial isoform X1 [Miniopterus natalensis]